MSIRALYSPTVEVISPQAGIAEAAIAMRSAHVGDVVVVEQRAGKTVPIGMLTDRDLVVEVLAERVDPAAVTVADIMSGDVVTVHESSGLEFALQEMGRAGVRRLPVVNDEGELVGILTSDDVIDHLGAVAKHLAEALATQQASECTRRP